MNTNPDETKLALWLDDELTGNELAEMNAWAANHPEQLAAREELRKFRGFLATHVSTEEEPPYSDFFLTRINQGIREAESTKAHSVPTVKRSSLRSWFIPLAACAGMVLAFSIGRQTVNKPLQIVTQPATSTTSPLVYTPEEGVFAEWIQKPQGNASVLLLKGISAIPDSTDFSETVYIPSAGEFDRTATLETEPSRNSTE